MKLKSSIYIPFLIVLLLFSQVASAFASVPVMQDCGMDMSMDAHDGDSSAMRLMADASSNDSNDDMDCCDSAEMNGQTRNCCDVQCQCSSLVSSLFIVSKGNLGKHYFQAEDVLMDLFTLKHTPFIQQPKRPPIQYFS